MTSPTFVSIEPLIVRAVISGDRVRCVFGCPISGDTFDASAPLHPEEATRDGVLVSLTQGLREGLSRWISLAFGQGSGQSAHDTSAADEEALAVEDAQRERAILAAFEQVKARFVWDGGAGRWLSVRVAVGVVPEFTRQLSEYPVTSRYDRVLLARMLAEIAASDGVLSADEEAFLQSFLPEDLGPVAALLDRPRLSALELREAAQGPERETLLMVCWAMALTDEHLAEEEVSRLGALARGLGLSEQTSHELRHYARVFLVDQALDRVWQGGGFSPSKHQQVRELAESFELDEVAFSTIDSRHRQRNSWR